MPLKETGCEEGPGLPPLAQDNHGITWVEVTSPALGFLPDVKRVDSSGAVKNHCRSCRSDRCDSLAPHFHIHRFMFERPDFSAVAPADTSYWNLLQS